MNFPSVERNGGPYTNHLHTPGTNGTSVIGRWIPWKVDTRYAIYDKVSQRWSDELFPSLQKCINAIRGMEQYYSQHKEKLDGTGTD